MNGMKWLKKNDERDFCFTAARRLFDPNTDNLNDDESVRLVRELIKNIARLGWKEASYSMTAQRLARICMAHADSPTGCSSKVARERYKQIYSVFNAQEQDDYASVFHVLRKHIMYYTESLAQLTH
jgi:hypothetical protein